MMYRIKNEVMKFIKFAKCSRGWWNKEEKRLNLCNFSNYVYKDEAMVKSNYNQVKLLRLALYVSFSVCVFYCQYVWFIW